MRSGTRRIGAAWAAGTITLLSAAGGASAALLNPSEWLGTNYYAFTFGAQGSGAASLSGYGMQAVGVYSIPDYPIRLYDSGTGGTQVTGAYSIPYKTLYGTETITDLLPNRPPTIGSPLWGGGSFDGTALWLQPGLFQPGQAPALGSDSPPTTGIMWDGTTNVAGTGSDARSDSSHLIQVPVPVAGVTNLSYLFQEQIYVPNHNADRQGANPISYNLRPQPSLDRGGFGLTVPGGVGLSQISFAGLLDSWNLLQIRADLTINGGTSSGSSDDSGSVTYTYYLDGVQVLGPYTLAFYPFSMTTPTGPINLGAFLGMTRGWQSDAPEVFVDNIAAFQIIPEPSVVAMVAVGGLALWWRRQGRRK